MKKLLAYAFAAAMMVPAVFANEADLQEQVRQLQKQLAELQQRVDVQENSNRLINEWVEEPTVVVLENEDLSFLEGFAQLQNINDRVSLSGNVDIVAFFAETDDSSYDTDSSDILVDQVRLALDIDITDNVKALVALQYEDYQVSSPDEAESVGTQGGDLQVDEAYIEIGGEEGIYSRWGKQYFNFGDVAEFGNFINDTLARQLSELRDTGVTLGYRTEGLDLSVWALNASQTDADDAADMDDEIDTYGASLAFSKSEEDSGVTLGVSYTSNLYASDNSVGGIGAIGAAGTFEDEIAAIAAYGSITSGPLWLHVQWVSALDETDEGATENEPEALSVEAAFTFAAGDQDWTLAAKWEDADEVSTTDEDVEAEIWGLSLSTEIYENTRLTLNYENQEWEDSSDETDVDWFALELSVSF